MSTALQLKPISDLLNYQFFIPSYQRGYRWTKQEVTDLLDDICQFIGENQTSRKEVFYCLQPVIIFKKENNYVLIDGQQRLTTIHLVLTYLKDLLPIFNKNQFSLVYETRDGSVEFLKTIDETKKDDNVDFYHIWQAYKAIEEWFKHKDGTLKIDILKVLCSDDSVGKNVKVIWYEIEPPQAINIFTRINIGRIPLTNAELIKALFLQKSNFTLDYELKQIQIATEWDAIEKRLQNDSFWYFIQSSSNEEKYENRIEYVFDLVCNKHGDPDALFTFHSFNILFEADKKNKGSIEIDIHWKKIKQYFSILEEWYENTELYHYIGFLLEYNSSAYSLIQDSFSHDKDKFLVKVKEEVKKKIGDLDLDNLSYASEKDKKDIKKCLLLFNIETLLATQKAIVRFPFDRYKKESWDIEHVNSQTKTVIDKRNFRRWANDLLDYFTGISLTENIDEQQKKSLRKRIDKAIENLDESLKKFPIRLWDILQQDGFDESRITQLSEDLLKEFKENKISNNDSIANLALLDESTNRGYGNAMFPIKRKRIIDNDKEGVFVPICTKNMFLKYYSVQMGEVMYWQQQDADNYLLSLKETLSHFLADKP